MQFEQIWVIRPLLMKKSEKFLKNDHQTTKKRTSEVVVALDSQTSVCFSVLSA